MFENTPSPNLESYVVTLVGDPGVGKTTFFVEAEALLLDFELGYKAMECSAVSFVDDNEPSVNWSQPHKEIIVSEGWKNLHPWMRFKLFVNEFCWKSETEDGFTHQGLAIPKSLAIDSIDACYDECVDYVCKQNKWESPDDGGKFGRGWKVVLKEFRMVIERILRWAHTPNVGCGVGFISHAKVRQTRSFGQEPIDKVTMALSPSAAKWLFAISDFVFYAECAVDMENKDIRVLHTQPTARFDAKSRGRRDIPFPSPLPLAYQAFAASWKSIVGGESPEAVAVKQAAPVFTEAKNSSIWS